MRNVLRRIMYSIDGALLVILSLAMIALMLSGNHWLYLSPRFQWLSWLTAAMLLMVGTMAVLHPGRTMKTSSKVVLGAFVVLGIAGNALVLQPHPTEWGLYRPYRAVNEEPYKALGDVAYTRINLAELYEVSEIYPEKHHELYVTRGMVQRLPELDASGEFLLVRTLIWCCLADAVAVGFRVRGMPDDMDLPPSGQWMELYGILQEDPTHSVVELPPGDQWGELHGTLQEEPTPSMVDLPHALDAFPLNIQPRFVLTPQHLVPTQEPDIAFIFEIRGAKPYAY